MTHDYRRNGTVDLFAALNVATGEVLHQTRRRHTGRDVLAFFKRIDLHTPRHLDVHIVLDNLSAHKSQPVRDWLAHPKRKRWHLHFTPTSASLAQPHRGMVLGAHPQGPHKQQLQLRRRPHRHHRHLGPKLERQPPTLRLDPTRRRHHRQGKTRTSRPNQNRDGPLGGSARVGCG